DVAAVEVSILALHDALPSRPGRAGRGKAGNDQAAGGRWVDRDAILAAGDRARNRVGGGQRLAARCLESSAESVDASVGGHESVVGRQGGLAVAAAEAHRAQI